MKSPLYTAAFLLGLGFISPAQAQQNSSLIVPPAFATFDDDNNQPLQPVLNIHPQAVTLAQSTTNTIKTPSDAELQHADQTLTNDKSQLQGDQAALDQLNQKLQSDQKLGNASAAQQTMLNIQALQQKIMNDQALVKDDRTQTRQLLQPEISAVKTDRQNLQNTGVEIRNDQQNNNTAALQQDLINQRAAQQVLKNDASTLHEDRNAAGLIRVNDTTGVATGVGNGTNIGNGTTTTNTNTSTVAGPPIGSNNGPSNTTNGTSTTILPNGNNPAIPTTSDTTGQVIINDPTTTNTDPNLINAGTGASAGIGPNGSVPSSTGLPTGSTAVPASTGLPTTQSTNTANTNSAAVPSSTGLPPNPNTIGHAPPTAAQGATSGSRK